MEIDWSKIPKLVERYSGAGPRYTSYPTAVEFHSGVGNTEWREAVTQELASEERAPLSLYFHIPFCKSLCYFCACNKIITQDASVAAPYLRALIREVRSYRELLGETVLPVQQIHWGGGSPNYLTPDQIEELHRATVAHFPELESGADISVELDPRTTSDEQLMTFRRLGFNRISLGVQDFNPVVQEAVNRIQTFEMTQALVDDARKVGFQGVNLDLIYGLPLQSVEGFKATVDQVLQIRPDRIALYGYAHVTWLHKVQRSFHRHPLPTPQERIEVFLCALRALSEAGYEYIGLDHFALPQDSLTVARECGKLNRNFMGYTAHRGARILGFGASSISSLERGFAQNVKEIQEYQRLIDHQGGAIERGLLRSADDSERNEIIQSILCRGELELNDERRHRFAKEITGLREFEENGVVRLTGERLELTPLGRLFARNVAMVFDAYLERHKEGKKPVFSQAV